MTELERIRREKQLTQFQLAIKTEIEQSRISNYETLRNNIDNARIETICKFAKALNVKAWEILNDKNLSEMLQNVSENEESKHEFWFDGTRLEEMRKREKMTQCELSRETNIAQCRISSWECGSIETAHIENICTLCIFLNCNPCDLIDNKTLREQLREVL